MNKRPGHVKVTVETGYCSFCDRTRNLRREERQLGALVRTVVACESCHRILSSTIGVAGAEPSLAPEVAAVPEAAQAPVTAGPAGSEAAPRARRAPAATRPKAGGSKAPAPKGKAQRSK